jgi:hypothetical protein
VATLLALIVSAACLIVLVAYLTRRRSVGLRQHALQVREIDRFPMNAFQNLVDGRELQFLKTHLSRENFLRCQRKRTRALISYVYLLLGNTRVMLRCVHAAAQSTDPVLAQSARNLLDVALKTRLNAMKALAVLSVALVFPNVSCDLERILADYRATYDRSVGLSSAILQ